MMCDIPVLALPDCTGTLAVERVFCTSVICTVYKLMLCQIVMKVFFVYECV